MKYLTPTEREILLMIANDMTDEMIARRRQYSSAYSVRNHIKSIFAKLKVNDRDAAVGQAFRLGIITPTEIYPKSASLLTIPQPREARALYLASKRRLNLSQISAEMHIPQNVARDYLNQALRKLGGESIDQNAEIAELLGLFEQFEASK